MENRTKLKEKRNNWLWCAFSAIYFLGFVCFFIFANKEQSKDDDFALLPILGVPLLFLIYRILTYLFNQFLLLFFRRKIKINRLKGRVSPIYKVEEYISYFTITKFSAQYTNLDLEWSIPFSVLFQEQEYIKDKSYDFSIDLEGVTHIALLWEEKHAEKSLKREEKISAKTIKQQKIDNLNKEFNENYK